MFKYLITFVSFAILLVTPLRADELGKEAKVEGKHGCFEMRTYTAGPGKLDALHARFREHTNALFLKHGMTVIGYWTPVPLDKPTPGEVDKATNTLVYILAYPDRETRDKMWKAFQSDLDWKKAREDSEKNGKLVDHVDSVFYTAMDYSPIK